MYDNEFEQYADEHARKMQGESTYVQEKLVDEINAAIATYRSTSLDTDYDEPHWNS